MKRIVRSLLPMVAALCAFVPIQVNAESISGLNVTVYDNWTGFDNEYNNAPPIPPITPICLETTWNRLIWDFQSDPVCDLYDDFQVNIDGYITSPETATYEIYMHGDDGVKLYLDGQLVIDAWYDSGNAGYSVPITFEANVPKALNAWYYENGGGAQVRLEYLVDNAWTPVPDSWFTRVEPAAPTTTTTLVPYFNPVQNLTATANADGSVNLSWEAPSASNTNIYGYSINFVDFDNQIERGGWGVWTLAANTTFSLGHWMFDGSNPVTTGYGQVRFKVYAMNGVCAGVGTGSCLYGPSTNVDATVMNPSLATTTTVSVTTTTDSPVTTSTIPNTVVTTTVADVSTTIVNVTTTVVNVTTTVQVPTVTTSTMPTVILPPLPSISPTTSEAPTSWVLPTVQTDETYPTTPETMPDTIPMDTIPLDTIPLEPIIELPVDNTIPSMILPEIAETVPGVLENPISDTTLETAINDLFNTTNADVAQITEQLTTLLESDFTAEQFAALTANAFDETATLTEMSAVLETFAAADLSEAEFTTLMTEVFDEDLSDTETIALVETMFEIPLSAQEFASVLEAVFDKPVSDAVLVDTFTAVLGTAPTNEQFAEVVNILESETITAEQVATVVDLVLAQDAGISEGQATELATSSKVLESIDGEQATEVFDAIEVSNLSTEDGTAIATAVQGASNDVRSSFEEELNVFDGVFDVYTALGSSETVATRRVIIGASALIFAMPLPLPTIRRIRI